MNDTVLLICLILILIFCCLYQVNKPPVSGTVIDKYISYEIPEQSQNCCKVEIWNYDPQLFADENNNVDIISLYSSFMNLDDERVHIELEELMEEYLNDRIRKV